MMRPYHLCIDPNCAKDYPWSKPCLRDLAWKCTFEKILDSKTECVFFPPPGYFKQLAILAEVPESDLLALEETDNDSDQKRETRNMIEDMLYDDCHETDVVELVGGFVTYCKHFKYLGSWLSYNL